MSRSEMYVLPYQTVLLTREKISKLEKYKRGMKKETTLTIVLAIFIFDLHYTCGDEHIPLLEVFSTLVKNKRGECKEVMATSIGGSEYSCNQLATPLGGDENKKERTKRLNCNRVRKKRTLAP